MMISTRILLVEDNPGDARLVKEALTSQAAEVLQATSVATARQVLAAEPVDVVLLDLGLEDASGWEALEAIKTATSAPIVLLTGQESSDVAMNAVKRGADDYIAKMELHEFTLPRVLQYAKDRRALQDQLRKSEQNFRTILRDVPAIVYTARGGVHGAWEFVSPQIEYILGFTAGEWMADPTLWARQIHPDDAERVHEAEARSLEKDRPGDAPAEGSMEYRMLRRDDSVVWIRDVARLVNPLDPAGPVWQGVMLDITREATAEAELRQAQKMEAIGQLAGGIAHDFNNVLAVVLNYAVFLSDDTDPQNEHYEDLQEIIKAAELGAALTRQLLTFSRREIRQPIILDVNQTVVGMERLLSRTIRESIQLKTNLTEDLWPVVADAGHIEQILMNLAVNAKDAMPTGGTLFIETQNVFVDADYASLHADMATGEYACLSVSDTGSGMSQETREHIFEPFFTTKPKDRGTGLGLATVYGIVRQSGGHVACYSEEGVGTTFKVYLPRTEASKLRSPLAVEFESALDERCGVLLVEDEDAVRRIGKRILERAGFEVFAASSGHEAFSVFDDHADQIDLLITDVIMPGGITGKDLSDRVDRPTLFISGYTDNIVGEASGLGAEEWFLHKPFKGTDLVSAAKAALSAGPGSHRKVG